jgi:hypothetical protein
METRLLIAYLLMAILVAAGAFVWRYTIKKQRERRGHARSRHNKRTWSRSPDDRPAHRNQ